MYSIYFISYMSLLGVVLLRKRSLDFIMIYALTLLLFNFSTLLKISSHPYFGYIKPHPLVYFYSSIPLILVIPFLFKEVKRRQLKSVIIKNEPWRIFLFLIIVFFFFIARNNISLILNPHNHEESFVYRSLQTLLFPVPVIGFIISYFHRSKKLQLFFLFLSLIILFTGGRSALAFLGIGYILIRYSGKKIRLISQLKFILFALAGLIVIVVTKKMYSYTLSLGFSLGLHKWVSEFELSEIFTSGAEFMSTSGILNIVVSNEFSFSSYDLFTSLLSILPIPMSFWGLSSGVFNERFQSRFFSNVDYGMAYNIWAEAYSWGGLLGIILYSFLIPFILYNLWRIFLKNKGKIVSVIIMLIGILFSFWIHRNSMGNILAYVRNVFYPMILIYILSLGIQKIKIKIKK